MSQEQKRSRLFFKKLNFKSRGLSGLNFSFFKIISFYLKKSFLGFFLSTDNWWTTKLPTWNQDCLTNWKVLSECKLFLAAFKVLKFYLASLKKLLLVFKTLLKDYGDFMHSHTVSMFQKYCFVFLVGEKRFLGLFTLMHFLFSKCKIAVGRFTNQCRAMNQHGIVN